MLEENFFFGTSGLMGFLNLCNIIWECQFLLCLIARVNMMRLTNVGRTCREGIFLRMSVTWSTPYGVANTCKLVTPAKQSALN
jgi:hypothetical protein